MIRWPGREADQCFQRGAIPPRPLHTSVAQCLGTGTAEGLQAEHDRRGASGRADKRTSVGWVSQGLGSLWLKASTTGFRWAVAHFNRSVAFTLQPRTTTGNIGQGGRGSCFYTRRISFLPSSPLAGGSGGAAPSIPGLMLASRSGLSKPVT